MSIATYRTCKFCGQLHDVSNWPKNHIDPAPQRGDFATPLVIGDTMREVQSMLDGAMYDSKSALRATYRRAGVEEVGNDSSVLNPKPFKKPEPNRKEIDAAVGKALSRVGLGA